MSRQSSAFLAGAALFAITLASYAPAILDGGFVWDDDDYVTQNANLRDFEGLTRIWTDPSATPQYYPLTHTTFWIEYQLWGLNPSAFHAGNVLLHAATAILLWLVLTRLGVRGAWLAAALFALHPVHVESVAWITERKNVLSGLLWTASLACWIDFFRLDRSRDGFGAPKVAACGAVLFVGALLAKTVTSTLPLTLLVIAWWKRGRVGGRLAVYSGAMLAAGALMGGLTSWLERHQVGAVGDEWSLTLVERVTIAGRAWWFYLGKLVWPAELNFIYPRWELADPLGLVRPAAALALIVILWAYRERIGRGPLAALSHYTIALAPALGFFSVYPMRFSFVADHFQYLASLGPLVLIAALLATIARRLEPAPIVAGLGVVLLLATLATRTWSRTHVYESRELLWEETLARNPDAWIAHNNLGAIRSEQGRVAEAEAHFRRVLELKPDHVRSRKNLGVLYLRTGVLLERDGRADEARARFDDALRLLLEAVEADPDDADGHANLADAQLALGAASAADESYTRAIRLRPEHAHARAGLGRSLMRQGRFDEAVRHLTVAVRTAPGHTEARFNLGIGLARSDRRAEAIEQLGRLLEIDPDHGRARYNRGTLLAQEGRIDEAERDLAEAVRLDPGDTRARRNLDQVRNLLGR